jgi:hypothetical protein
MSSLYSLQLVLLGTLMRSASTSATVTETVIDIIAPHDRASEPSRDQSHNSPPLQNVYLLLLLGIPLVWYLAWVQKAHLPAKKAEKKAELQEWEEPWLTNDWATLFGLIRLSNDNEWRHTPFWYYKDIQLQWHHPDRPWLKRLLALGIIPLFIQDGGIDTYHTHYSQFSRTKTFPYFTTPRWQQGKRRAFFDFLIPHPGGSVKMHQFVDSVINNRSEADIGDNPVVRDNSYAVTIRDSPPDRGGSILYSEQNHPAPEDRPFEVGAKSVLKLFLPFMSDEDLKKEYGVWANCLSYYMRSFRPESVPLLRHAPIKIVRVESYHYGACELDAFVFGLAQEAGLEVEWPEGRCREAALTELEQCGLPVDGLASSGDFGPDRYK